MLGNPELKKVFVDTGEAGAIFRVDKLLGIGVRIEPEDRIHRVYGVGGSEFVFAKVVDFVRAGCGH